jgi:hypothetical protein
MQVFTLQKKYFRHTTSLGNGVKIYQNSSLPLLSNLR